jgi:hypothetical protein
VVHTWSMNLLALLSETGAPGEVLIDDTWYSPGVVGFIATFSMGGAAVLLVIDLVRRVRRVRYRAEIKEKLDLEQLEQSLLDSTEESRAKPDRPAPPEKPQR